MGDLGGAQFRGEVLRDGAQERGGISPGQADVHRVPGKMRGVEALDVVQGDGLQSLNRPGIDVAKGMTLIEGELQGPLAQVFIVVSPELVGEEIDRFISQAGEVLWVESGG